MELKFTSKSLQRKAKKCEEEEKSEKLKIKKAMEKGNIDGARIYAKNAIQKRTEQMNYLRLASHLSGLHSRFLSHSLTHKDTISLPLSLSLSLSLMASNNNSNMNSPSYMSSDPTSPNTTFVQADLSTFRDMVQKLTGALEDPSAQKLPLNHKPLHLSAIEIGPRKHTFKLHEHKLATKKLKLKFNPGLNPFGPSSSSSSSSPSGPYVRPMIFSPVSPFKLELYARGSPRTPREVVEEEEERAIAEKGFYLNPSPLTTPCSSDPPELLPLFPLHSPTNTHTISNDNIHNLSSSPS